MKKIFVLLFLTMMLGMFSSVFATDIIIGTGTSTQSYPFDVYYGYGRSVSLYTQAEVTQYGTISQLAWYVGTARATVCPTFCLLPEILYMGGSHA